MKRPSKWLASLLALMMIWSPIPAIAEDIDVFSGGSIAATNPSILFVLDNTSNWARQSQQWPGGLQQGQSEARAIKSLINDASAISSGVNIGLFEFVTEGNANNSGGFVRFPISPMDTANKATLSTKLDTIFNGVNAVSEKRNSNTEYGWLISDVYNYLTGSNTHDTLSPPNPDAASTGYTTPFTTFKSPITAANGCGRIFMVFIGNPNSSGPADDSAANKTKLASLSCDTTNVGLPNFTTSSIAQQASLGSGVYASQAACEAAAATTHGAAYASYSCALSSAVTNTTTLGTSTCGQYASQAVCEAAGPTAYPGYSSYTCSGATACTVTLPTGTTALGTTTCGQYATAAACQTGAASTWPGYNSYSCASAGSCTSTDLDGAACYATSAACQSTVLAANPGYNSVACSTATSCNKVVSTCAAANAYNNAASCNAGAPAVLGGTYTTYTCSSGANCTGGKTWTITGSNGTSSYPAIGTGTRYSVTGTSGGGTAAGTTFTIIGNTVTNTYNIFGNYTATASVPTGTYSSTSNMWMADEWARCLNQKDMSPDGVAGAAETFTADFSSSGIIVGADTITFDGVTTTLAGAETPAQIAAAVKAGTYPNWTTSVSGNIVTFITKTIGELTDVTAGSFTIVDADSTGTQPAVVVTTTVQGVQAGTGALGRQNVTTYTIDVYNAQQNAEHTGLMMSMAQQGGGRYFAAKSEAQILTALKEIVSEIQSVNTAFAAASIPLSTTNRSQNLNEVYIGVFRPSLEPRWFGNLKKFKIATVNGTLDLVDSLGTTALNSQTGFLNDCATSFWTADSGAWWNQVKIGALNLTNNALINPVPSSTCVAMPGTNTSVWSDLPDGQSVEKGAVAGTIRRGNNPPSTAASPTWQVNRTIYTRSGSSLVALDSTNAGSTDLYNYIRGVDINVDGVHVAEKTLVTAISDAVRPSVHGDVVHSRPLAVNYGVNDTVIYYGANDGMLRAVDGATGKEKWAFIPKEFLDTTKQTRLMQNTPAVAFGAAPAAGSTVKNYMFDGSPGLFQSAGNTSVWLYPAQRRGGRRIHALDVTNSSSPSLKWYHGCRDLDNDSVCSSDFEDIGQTWSIPIITKIKGYSTTRPVVVFGGGYDNCEDVKPTTNPPTWDCSSGKGHVVYFVDAEDGTLLKRFTHSGMRGVTAGISFVDIDNDGYSDYAYVADLGGAIYRLSFINSPTTPTALTKDNWSIKKVAYTDGSRKFMFTPAVTFGGGSTIYVAIGSGDRERPLAEDYPYVSNIRNYVYAYRDVLNTYNAATTACNLDGDPSATGACVLDYTTSPSTCTSPGILPTATDPKQAWRVGFVYQGEQAVTQPIILGGMVAVNTTRPVPAGVCSAALGEGGGYFLNLVNGSGAIGVDGNCGGSVRGKFTGVGLPTDPVVVNLPGEDPICIGCVSKTNTSTVVGSKLFQPTPVPPPISKRKFRKYRYTVVD
jgi:hypothetical protein